MEDNVFITEPTGGHLSSDGKNIYQTDGSYAKHAVIIHPMLGDADGDGDIGSVDATVIQRKLSGLKIPGSFIDKAADADGDEEVSIIDATLIQRYLAYMTTPFKIGDPL